MTTTTFERDWYHYFNITPNTVSSANAQKSILWNFQAALCGHLGNVFVNGLNALTGGLGFLTPYSYNDGAGGFGNGDGIQRWSTVGSTTANSGAAASITTGATSTNYIRLTGLTGMSAASVGNYMTISGAASAGNNSKTNTPFRIVNYVSATSVDIYNPSGVTGDANNGSITWQERTAYTADLTKVVQAAAGTNHSWAVLKGNGYYLIIDCNSATGNVCSLSWSVTAPSAGTATAAPSAADQVSLSAITFCASNTTQKLNFSIDDNSDFQFWLTDTGNAMSAAWIFQKPADYKSADTYPFVMYYKQGSTCLSSTNLGTAANWAAKNFNGSANLTGFGVLDLHVASTTASIMGTMTLQDYTDMLYDSHEYYLANTTGGATTRKGRLQDLTACPQGLATGYCEPTPGSPISMVMGSTLWVPAPTMLLNN